MKILFYYFKFLVFVCLFVDSFMILSFILWNFWLWDSLVRQFFSPEILCGLGWKNVPQRNFFLASPGPQGFLNHEDIKSCKALLWSFLLFMGAFQYHQSPDSQHEDWTWHRDWEALGETSVMATLIQWDIFTSMKMKNKKLETKRECRTLFFLVLKCRTKVPKISGSLLSYLWTLPLATSKN